MKGLEIELQAPKGVYEPAEDSFLLAKWVAEKAKGRVLDVGTGSGIQAIAAALNGAREVTGVDANPLAVECARRNAGKNGVAGKCVFIQSNLFEKVEGEFDLIVFNPPYIPVEKKEDAAWDGGKDGRKVIDAFLHGFERHLGKGGSVLMVCSTLSDTEKTVRALEEKRFQVKKLEEKSFFFEKICVLEAKRA